MATRGRPTALDYLYSSAKWRRIRKLQLLHSPLCVLCLKRGIATPATICDHVTPHVGDVNKFWLGDWTLYIDDEQVGRGTSVTPDGSNAVALHRDAILW